MRVSRMTAGPGRLMAVRSGLLLALALLLALPAQAADCPADFQAYGPGDEIICSCPDAPTDGQVWGTATYTNDSAICNAARHAGLIGGAADAVLFAGGGDVRVRGHGGCDSYGGSTRNGIATADYGAWGGSFYFPAVTGASCAQTFEPAPPPPELAACPETLGRTAGSGTLDCLCPADASGDIWGSGPYAADSAVCAAARHAGAVGPGGGEIQVAAMAGCERYIGSAAGGLTSFPWDDYGTSLYFPAFGRPQCPAALTYEVDLVGMRAVSLANPFFLEDADTVVGIASVVEEDGWVAAEVMVPGAGQRFDRVLAGDFRPLNIRVWRGPGQEIVVFGGLYKVDPVLPNLAGALVGLGSAVAGGLIAAGSGGTAIAAGAVVATLGQAAAGEVRDRLGDSARQLGDAGAELALDRWGDLALQPTGQIGSLHYHFSTTHTGNGGHYELYWLLRH